MPKIQISKLESIRKWIELYNNSGEVFKILNKTTFICQHCQKKKSITTKGNYEINTCQVIFT